METKIGHTYKDGSKITQRYYFNRELEFIVYLDQNKRVIYKSNSTNGIKEFSQSKLLCEVLSEMDSIIPFFRGDLNQYLAVYYNIILSGKFEPREELLEKLLLKIEARKKLIKKIVYTLVPLIIIVLAFPILICLNHFFQICEGKADILLFIFFGHFISTVKNIEKINFNTSETLKFYIYFSFIKFLFSVVTSIILVTLYKSNIINLKLNISENSINLILASIGGYSENLVPDLFESIVDKISEK